MEVKKFHPESFFRRSYKAVMDRMREKMHKGDSFKYMSIQDLTYEVFNRETIELYTATELKEDSEFSKKELKEIFDESRDCIVSLFFILWKTMRLLGEKIEEENRKIQT